MAIKVKIESSEFHSLKFRKLKLILQFIRIFFLLIVKFDIILRKQK